MKPSCETFQDLIIAVSQGEPIEEGERKALEIHLRACPECRAFQRDLPGILEGIKEDSPPALPEGFFEEMKTSILGELAKRRPPSPWRRAVKTLFGRFEGRGILVPALSGLCGLLVGMALATAWMRTPSSPASVRSSANRLAAVSLESLPVNDSTVCLGVVEDYMGVSEFFDALSDQDIQALTSDLSGDFPDPDQEEMGSETG